MTAEMRLILAGGMIFPGNGALLSGSVTGGVLAEKSPVRWAAVGPCAVLLAPWRVRSHSPATKKKVLFLFTGPPVVNPNWFCWKGAFFTSKKLRVLKSVLRTNSQTDERRVGKECRSRWSPYH